MVVNNERPIVPNGAAVYTIAAKVHAAPVDVRISAVPDGVPEWIHHINGLAPGVKVKWTKLMTLFWFSVNLRGGLQLEQLHRSSKASNHINHKSMHDCGPKG